jgi:polyhydroxybutyrate depolymerase
MRSRPFGESSFRHSLHRCDCAHGALLRALVQELRGFLMIFGATRTGPTLAIPLHDMKTASHGLFAILGFGFAGLTLGCVSAAVSTEEYDPPVSATVARGQSTGSSNHAASDQVSLGLVAASAEDPACVGKVKQPLDATWTVPMENEMRVFNVHVPTSYSTATPTPVVLNFHGLGSDGTQQDELSGMSRKADAEGFIAVHPEGLGVRQSWNAGPCCGFASENNVDDIGFVHAMLDVLESTLCIDASRVFVTGMSNGALFTQRVGCELASRVAAIAPVAGVLVEPICVPARPMPVVEFHGTLDPIEPYDGDPEEGWPSVPDTFAAWATRDGCTDDIAETYDDHDSQCVTHQRCGSGSSVTLCTVEGGGHTWPGGEPIPRLGYTTPYLSATDAMWTFFEANALR